MPKLSDTDLKRLRKAIKRVCRTDYVFAGSADLTLASKLAKEHEAVCSCRMFKIREGKSSSIHNAVHIHCAQCDWNADATDHDASNP